MNEIIEEIRKYIERGYFKNEENIRFSLVARILQKLGWDIWNPKEVATEFPVSPNEDSTRVDIALFDNAQSPSVFIETKALGKLETELGRYEIQLRDYNRNNTAPFSIITDGRQWRFYYSQTGGEFSQKCFKVLDLLNDDAEDIELSFYTFLSKEDIRSGKARNEAETYLKLSQKQRALEDALPQARRQILESPFPSLPEALVKIVTEENYTVSIEEAIRFVKKQSAKKPKPGKPVITSQSDHRILSGVKTKKSSGGKDHTCYDIILAGSEFCELNKRKAIYKIVRFLCDSGITPRQITEAAKYRPNHLFRDCEGVVSAQEFDRHMENQTERKYDRKRYFKKDEELIVSNGSTYALWNQWGPSTTEVIQKIVKSFPQHPIQLTVHEDN